MDKVDAGNFGRRWQVVAVALLFGLFSVELAFYAKNQSQTFDEACHLFAGYRSWTDFDFGINPEHPPLVKLVAAVPLLGLPLHIPTLPEGNFKGVEYRSGREFLYANSADALLFRARMSCALFTIGLALVAFFMARSMWGNGPAFFALTLLVFEPNLIAHGALVTTDMGVTCFLVASVYGLYQYGERPTLTRLVVTGVAAGLCLASKHSGLLVLPILLFLALLDLAREKEAKSNEDGNRRETRPLPLLYSMAGIFGIAWIVLWSTYGFRFATRGPGLQMDPSLPESALNAGPTTYTFVTQFARYHLLPESYLYGLVDILNKRTPAFLFGKINPGGQWIYFPAVFVIKSTLAFLILCAVGFATRKLWTRENRREATYLIFPPAFYFAIAMGSGINSGVRHILIIYPFLIILAAYGAWNLAQHGKAFAISLAFLFLFHAASSLYAFPNYISYANEFWGGPAKAHLVLSDSNVDWGQGLKAMRKYVDERRITNCWFAYFESVAADFTYYGIPCNPLPASHQRLSGLPMQVIPQFVDGPVFISTSELTGPLWGNDSVNPYTAFRNVPPSDLIADSILVFEGRFDLSAAAAMTHESAVLELVKSNQPGQALTEAEIAVSLTPDSAAAHFRKGYALSVLKRREEAQAEFQKARSLMDPLEAAP